MCVPCNCTRDLPSAHCASAALSCCPAFPTKKILSRRSSCLHAGGGRVELPPPAPLRSHAGWPSQPCCLPLCSCFRWSTCPTTTTCSSSPLKAAPTACARLTSPRAPAPPSAPPSPRQARLGGGAGGVRLDPKTQCPVAAVCVPPGATFQLHLAAHLAPALFFLTPPVSAPPGAERAEQEHAHHCRHPRLRLWHRAGVGGR